jgi:citrate lyase subunit beta/citryl-CoA lyase
LLFVPGDRPDQIEKAHDAGADALILDLEDSVAPQQKPVARLHVARFLEREKRMLPLFVRINPLDRSLTDDDLAVLADATPPDGIVLPKAEGSASVIEFERRLGALRISIPLILPIATETPRAVFRLAEYEGVADRLVGLTWGAEDVSAAVGATTSRLPDGSFTPPYEMVRALTLFAAHAAGVPAIETVYPAFRDHEGLAKYASHGARDGFTGMMAIHPLQVPIINEAFTPAEEDVARAKRIVEAFRNRPAAGVLSIDGVMLDAPHLNQAERILARAGASDEPLNLSGIARAP